MTKPWPIGASHFQSPELEIRRIDNGYIVSGRRNLARVERAAATLDAVLEMIRDWSTRWE